MRFTKKEISLCKQVAEKHRKGINWGDWYFKEGDIYLWHYWYESLFPSRQPKKITPLWTISDCLGFLGKKDYTGRIDFGKVSTRIYIFGHELHSTNWTNYPNYKGKTILEALLKAVLAVLEEKNE